MKQKLIILILIALPFAFCINAKEQNCMLVHFTDGSYAFFPISQMPKVCFDEGTIVISTERYQISNIKKYTFADLSETGIEDIAESGSISSFSTDDNNIYIKLTNRAQTIKLYTISGIELPFNAKPDEEGRIVVNLSQFSMYIPIF